MNDVSTYSKFTAIDLKYTFNLNREKKRSQEAIERENVSRHKEQQ